MASQEVALEAAHRLRANLALGTRQMPSVASAAADVRAHDAGLPGCARAAVPRRGAASHAVPRGWRRGVDRALTAEHVRSTACTRDSLLARGTRTRGTATGAAPAAHACAHLAQFHLAIAHVPARLCPGARAGAARGPADFLLIYGARGLRGAHARCGLSDSPRAGLRAPGPAQLLRAVRSQLLRVELSLGRRHAVRRQLVSAWAAADLDVPAVRRLYARDRRRPGLVAGAARGLAWRLGGARDAHGPAAGARVRVLADRLGQGDRGAPIDLVHGRAGRGPSALAVEWRPRGNPIRTCGRRRRGNTR